MCTPLPGKEGAPERALHIQTESSTGQVYIRFRKTKSYTSPMHVQQARAKFKLQCAGVISEGKSNSRAPGSPATTPAALDLDVTSKYETAWLLAL